MLRGEKLFTFLASLILRKFYGTITIRFEGGKVTHVTTESRQTWQYRDLPEQLSESPGEPSVGNPIDQQRGA